MALLPKRMCQAAGLTEFNLWETPPPRGIRKPLAHPALPVTSNGEQNGKFAFPDGFNINDTGQRIRNWVQDPIVVLSGCVITDKSFITA